MEWTLELLLITPHSHFIT